MPVVGDVSNTVGSAASIPGKAVGTASGVLSRDLPGAHYRRRAEENPNPGGDYPAVPGTVDNTGVHFKRRAEDNPNPGGDYPAVPGTVDNTGAHFKRDLPNIPAIPVVPGVVDTVAPVEAVPGNVLSGVLRV